MLLDVNCLIIVWSKNVLKGILSKIAFPKIVPNN